MILTGASLMLPALAAPAEPNRPATIYVEVQGSLQGATAEELNHIFAAQMAQTPISAWHFEAAGVTATHAANRVEWSLVPSSDATGLVRTFGFSRAMMGRLFGSHHIVRLEARVYLDNTYEGMVSGQIRDNGNPQDPDLVSEITELTRELMSPAVVGAAHNRSDLGRPSDQAPS
jgi:hypothetical protein